MAQSHPKTTSYPTTIVAIPYPGRGHVNPMLNLCTLIASKHTNINFTVILTEEWLDLLGPNTNLLPSSIRFATIPNVLPSEHVRALDFPGFLHATATKMEGPVEEVLDRIEESFSLILYDTHMPWAMRVGSRRGVPVASLWPMPATVFAILHHWRLLEQNRHLGVDVSERGEELVNYIPGVPPTRVADLPTIVHGNIGQGPLFSLVKESISSAGKSQFLLFTSVYELEASVIDALKAEFPIPVYSVGPAIPYFHVKDDSISSSNTDYVPWLDGQPEASVLYISQGSFLSASSAQLDEIIAGVHKSGVRFLWVARGEASRFKGENGDRGIVVPWCDQLKVLCHSSIGAFWSHCGWNSAKEGIYAGIPLLTFPLFMDQVPVSKMIVEDWKIGRRVKRDQGVLVTRDEIAELVRSFMNLESDEGKEMRKRAKELSMICRRSTEAGGSADTDIDAFIGEISKCYDHEIS